MDPSMMQTMMGCMIAGVVFALIIAVALVAQVVIQFRLLREVRRLRADQAARMS